MSYPEKLWEPDKYLIENSNIYHFMKWIESKTANRFSDYTSFHKWSISDLSEFWELFLEYSDVKTYGQYTSVLSDDTMPNFKWFEGLQLNYAENIFSAEYQGNAIAAVIEANENYRLNSDYKIEYTFDELKKYVEQCASALLKNGITKGDKVAGFIGNLPEAVIAALACSAIGAVWSSTSPDFGLEAVKERFSQINPKIVFANSYYIYNGTIHDNSEKVLDLKKSIDSIELIVSVPYPIEYAKQKFDISWNELLLSANVKDFVYEKFHFSHPLYIMFSSGTTGAPKCMIHSTGGTLLQHKKELLLHCDLKKGNKLLYYTTTGWMMWNWQLSALLVGATIYLYEGSPAYPDLFNLWEKSSDLEISHLGTSGRYIESCMKSQNLPDSIINASFDHLKNVLYTGSPLSAAGFKWVYNNVKRNLHLAGISGGTDIISCFVLGNPLLPVYAGRIQCKGLGVDVVAFDENGNEILNEPGELVCRKPIPSMPSAFLNDIDNKIYMNSYFHKYSGIWHHGDYIEFREDGSSIIYGRSDATLNPGGVRIGVAEIYSALDHLSYISGSLAVGWKPHDQSDELIILLVVLKDKLLLDSKIKENIRSAILKNRSPKHIPKYIFQISEIPVTRSGKPVELTIKAILAEKDISNLSSVANPHTLNEVYEIKKLLKENYI